MIEPPPRKAPSRLRKVVVLLVGWAVVVIALSINYKRGTFTWPTGLNLSRSWPWLLVAFCCVIGMTWLYQRRFWKILILEGESVAWRDVYWAGVVGWATNALLIGGGLLGADAARGFLLRHLRSWRELVLVTLLDRGAGFFSMISLASLGLWFGRPDAFWVNSAIWIVSMPVWCLNVTIWTGELLRPPSRRTALMAAWLAGLIAGAALIAPREFPSFLLATFVGVVLGIMVRWSLRNRTVALRQLEVAGEALRYSWWVQCLFTLAFFSINRSLQGGSALGFTQMLFAAPIAAITGILPLPANGLGVGELALDASSKVMNPESSGNATTYLVFRLVAICLGILILLANHWRKRSLPSHPIEPKNQAPSQKAES